MAAHFCQYTVSYETDFKAVPCDKPAPIKYEDLWLCAEHYDMIEESFGRAAEHGEFWGVDVGLEGENTVWNDPNICPECNCEFYEGECNCGS